MLSTALAIAETNQQTQENKLIASNLRIMGRIVGGRKAELGF